MCSFNPPIVVFSSTSCGAIKYEVQNIRFESEASTGVVWNADTRTLNFNGNVKEGKFLFTITKKQLPLDDMLDEHLEGTVKGTAYYALQDNIPFPQTFEELWEGIQDGNVISGGQMILVGNNQKLYPEQDIGINTLQFNAAPNYNDGAHYTVYAIPNTTYIGYPSGKATCSFGIKHISFYDFIIYS